MKSPIPLCDPDLGRADVEALRNCLEGSDLTRGEWTLKFEEALAAHAGRRHAIAVSGGKAGLRILLHALGIGPGDEVVCSAYSLKEMAHALVETGAKPVFADIDYWSGAIDASRVEARIGPATKAILASNPNGHPAPWGPLEELAEKTGIVLLEDSSEAVASTWGGRMVGSFGRASVMDFSHPSILCCGQGGAVLTDDDMLASRLRQLRGRRPEERTSVVASAHPCYGVEIGEIAAALGLAQLGRLESILLHRKAVETLYRKHVRSFEGIKDPYVAPEAGEVHWLSYVVHLGKRFTREARDAIVEDLHAADVEAWPYSVPLHQQRLFVESGSRRGDLPTTERISDRAVALPLHRNLSEEQIAFVVATMKDASVNVGAGAAIY